MPLVNPSPETTASQAAPDVATEDRTEGVEPSSWWWLISFALGAVGAYTLLGVHLILAATDANAWMLTLMAVPTAFFCSSAVALFVGSNLSARERLSAASAGLFGYSPRERRQLRRRA
jgi:hypothetical protein